MYETDFEDEVSLRSVIGLPAYFASLVVLESAYKLLEAVEDPTKEWFEFMKMVNVKWLATIIDKRTGWDRYVRMFKGRAQVPKRTFFQNQTARDSDAILPRIKRKSPSGMVFPSTFSA